MSPQRRLSFRCFGSRRQTQLRYTGQDVSKSLSALIAVMPVVVSVFSRVDQRAALPHALASSTVQETFPLCIQLHKM